MTIHIGVDIHQRFCYMTAMVILAESGVSGTGV